MEFARPANMDDVCFISDNMRPEDIEECNAFGVDHFDALRRSLEEAVISYTLFGPDNIPLAICGVSKSPHQHLGLIWMLGTDGIRKHRFIFLRQNKKGFLDRLYDESGYEALYNFTYAKNTLHHMWLRWLGFTFLRQVSLPPYDQQFYEFIRLREK